jgi:hypothetical protein
MGQDLCVKRKHVTILHINRGWQVVTGEFEACDVDSDAKGLVDASDFGDGELTKDEAEPIHC